MTKSKDQAPDNIDTQAMAELNRSVFAAIQKGATMKDLQGVSDAAMDGVYAYAYRFYQQGKLKEAESFFRFLFMYDFRCAEYPMGLAAVYQLRGEYVKAIEYYAIAASLAKEDLRPVFHAAQCHLCVGNRKAARRNFEMVLERAALPVLRSTAKACLEVMDSDIQAVDDGDSRHRTSP
jgi:type III secretion system low calcium response chaperone LcrH/SycD